MAKPRPAKRSKPILQTKKANGRPSTYNEATGTLICERIANGETLVEICRTKGIPSRPQIYRWRRLFPAFDAQYIRARADQMEAWSDDIVEIADDGTLDTMETTDKAGNPVTVANHANVQRDRMRIDTRKFLMSKLNRRYADKQEVNVTGSVQHTVELSDRERMRRLASFMLEDKQTGALIDGTAADLTSQSSPLPATDDREPVSNKGQSADDEESQ